MASLWRILIRFNTDNYPNQSVQFNEISNRNLMNFHITDIAHSY
ncbi:hypothetical protein HNQ93_002609 [Hymenobacter luteus]|uniref:Uncharacterized protein n=2 Tax=Hymenobacter TaxID=89966 RepID=A0A7W9T3F2_9BACT|nr:hypothetical protein [Hymenobacter latericoloratus]MBB6059749.1 hypothetical protein [Hymenobacter luteus]